MPVEPVMAEPTQETLYSIPPEDHLAMIGRMRTRRDGLRRQIAEHFAARVEIAKRMNAAEAEFDDLASGLGRSTDPKETINQLRASQTKRDRARADMRDAIARQRDLKAGLLAAQAELELSIGGIQRSMIEEAAHVEPAKHETAQALRSARQRAVADACVKALRALGGRASCVDLASLVGVSSHGLGGLIDGDPRMRKDHEGRLNNVQTNYSLVPGA
jgi:hypothetical protein